MRKVLWGFLSLSLLAAPALAQGTAPAPAPPAPPAAPSTELGGLVDVYYDFYSTKPSGDALYRNFDTKHNQFALSMAEVWLAKAPTADSRIGFKFKLNFGPAMTTFINAAEPGGTAFQNIEEAYVSYLAPAGKGLQFDVGKFVTHNGAEVIEAKDNWNYSRSLLFSWAIPYYHSGVRLTYSPNDKVTVMGGLVNGWNNVGENNSGKTVIGQLLVKPVSTVSFITNYTGGPEQAGDNKDWRTLSDTILTYSPKGKTSLLANFDWGHDTVAGKSVGWKGIAAGLKYQANKVVAFIPRVEYYSDPNAFTTGVAQTLKEVTATLELKAVDNFLWRIEYRGDMSDKAVFHNASGGTQKNQQSIGFGVLYSFTSKVQ